MREVAMSDSRVNHSFEWHVHSQIRLILFSSSKLTQWSCSNG